jgi:hypothetical protein
MYELATVTMFASPIIAEKHVLVRYAYEKLMWFKEYCEKWNAIATYHHQYRGNRQTVRVQIAHNVGMDENQWVIRDVQLGGGMLVYAFINSMWYEYEFASILFDDKFAQSYRNISGKVYKCMQIVKSLPHKYIRDVCRMWLRCARRLGVCKDIRMVINKRVFYDASLMTH